MFYSMDKTEDISPGHSISNNAESLRQGRGGVGERQDL